MPAEIPSDGLGVVVLGHHAEAIRGVLRQTPAPLPLTLAHNPEPGENPASSLRLGLAALSPDVDTIVVLLADQPLLGASELQRA